jgi:hypothetical protein
VRHESSLGARIRDFAWIAIPFVVYLALLRLLWFDAPDRDDYEAILEGTMRLLDAPSLGEWVQALLRQHNEHRIVVTRLVALAMAELTGRINFRILMLLASLGLAAIIFQLWVEFRDRAAAPLVAAAGSCFARCPITRAPSCRWRRSPTPACWSSRSRASSSRCGRGGGASPSRSGSGWWRATPRRTGCLPFRLRRARVPCGASAGVPGSWRLRGCVLLVVLLANYEHPPHHARRSRR